MDLFYGVLDSRCAQVTRRFRCVWHEVKDALRFGQIRAEGLYIIFAAAKHTFDGGASGVQ